MDSTQFMDAGTYAWIVIIIFFLIFSALQIRNCVRNVRGINNNFSEMYTNEAGTSCGQSSVYTIDVAHSTPSYNFTNPGYIPTEGAVKGQSNDGLPTYEEAIAGVKTPNGPVTTAVPTSPATVAVIDEENENVSSSRGRRHRHRRHRQQHNSDRQNENSQPDASEEHSRRHRHRRGFRLKRHLAKINRRNHTETD
ncbi:uncharacterized protein LOC116337719 isoform X2 [Contarinia nasturtii]|uniref:uncharacterized protein LOC116337719 isoform X2 n=1 Tax=Contarinia nasturtii TaxID=265458 RepID=UPI0012D411AA|nr:uncharacterized protein LOC116337719 isoform X2 [Contarinia nasturtii]